MLINTGTRARTAIAVALPIVAYGILVFQASTRNFFWLDDYGWVATAVLAASDPARLATIQAGFFRPVVNVAFLLNYAVSGLEPAGYYWANIGLHLGNALLVAALAYRSLGRRPVVAALAGVLFAGAVGNYGEAVIWICGRTELIATTFILVTLHGHQSFRESGLRRYWLLCVVTFVGALLSKESSASLLAVLVAFDAVSWRNRFGWRDARALAVHYLPFALAMALYLGYEIRLQLEHGLYASSYRLGWHIFGNMLEYLSLMILPITSRSTAVAVPASFASVLEVARWICGYGVLATLVALIAARTPAAVKAFALFIALTIVPYALFDWKTTTRYLYLPSIGLAIVVAWAAVTAWEVVGVRRWMAFWRSGLIGALFLVLGIQYAVVNYTIAEWHVAQVQRGPAEHQALASLEDELRK